MSQLPDYMLDPPEWDEEECNDCGLHVEECECWDDYGADEPDYYDGPVDIYDV